MDGNGTYVLVVDDLPDAADSLRELLVVWGYDAEARYGGAAALESVRTRPPAAVVLDVGMPRMDGFEFVARLRLVPGCERTPVVVVSGHTSEACQARGRELGIGHYLLKAADPNLLRELLSRLTMRPEPSRSRPTPRRRKNPRRGGAPSGDPGSGVEPTPDPSQEAVPCGPSRSRPTPRRRKNPRRGGAPSGDPGSGVEPTPDPSQEAVPCGS